MTLIEVNEANFVSEVLQSTVPVAIDFYGDYCAPCRMIKPALSLLAEELKGQAKIVTVDVMVGIGAFSNSSEMQPHRTKGSVSSEMNFIGQ